MIAERAPAKLNLVLQVGRPRPDGLHPLASLFATLELADEVTVEPAAADSVECPGVDGENLAARAVAAHRAESGVGPVAVRIDKRIPVAAGLGGGSADAAAVLRAADALAERPLGEHRLRALATALGSDVPSQVEPRHAVVGGVGERLEPVGLPRLELVLVPDPRGLSTAAVYAELDRRDGGRAELDPAAAHRAAACSTARELAPLLENDLEAAALGLRPELGETLAALRGAGAVGVRVTGSGPTAFGLFADAAAADAAAAALPGALRTATAE